MSRLRSLTSALILTLLLTPLAHAQIGSMGSASVQTEVMMEEYDLTTIDGTLEALYGVISFEKGGRQDWDGFDKLFVDGAILSQVSGNDYHHMTPEEYKENFKSNRSSGKLWPFRKRNYTAKPIALDLLLRYSARINRI
jgi:hypothetical protein